MLEKTGLHKAFFDAGGLGFANGKRWAAFFLCGTKNLGPIGVGRVETEDLAKSRMRQLG